MDDVSVQENVRGEVRARAGIAGYKKHGEKEWTTVREYTGVCHGQEQEYWTVNT